MIALPPTELPASAAVKLAEYQTEVNAERGFAARVAAAKRLFSARNTTRNAAFRQVRATLDRMCSGERRCCYCEDSAADEVEHIRPKDWFPERAFVWENYLYACGPCNGPKNNSFSVFDPESGEELALEDLTRQPTQAQRDADPLLIDPRAENPLDFLDLDLDGTFYFLPRLRLSSRNRRRAEYTIELLKLNERDLLVRARRNAFGTYRARVREYATRRDEGALEPELTALVDDLRRVPHPTVWVEMQRQADTIPRLRQLFDRCPEALDW